MYRDHVYPQITKYYILKNLKALYNFDPETSNL